MGFEAKEICLYALILYVCYMGKIVKIRRGNQSDTRFITIPREIADMYGLKIGTKLELINFSRDEILIRVKRDEI